MKCYDKSYKKGSIRWTAMGGFDSVCFWRKQALACNYNFYFPVFPFPAFLLAETETKIDARQCLSGQTVDFW